MTAFIIRRFLGMIAVLFAVSILVFLIFIIVPGGDPASRIAGKHPTPQNVVNIKKKWGFDKPFYVQYYEMMKKVGTGLLPGNHSQYDVLRSFDDQTNVLDVLFIGFSGRVLRSYILDTINEDYVRTARAMGLTPRRVLAKHVLRNSLIPVVTLFGLDFAAVLGGGAILTETVFELHGVGFYAAERVGALDLPPIMGVTLYGAFFIVVFSALVDFVYAWLDPRIRPT